MFATNVVLAALLIPGQAAKAPTLPKGGAPRTPSTNKGELAPAVERFRTLAFETAVHLALEEITPAKAKLGQLSGLLMTLRSTGCPATVRKSASSSIDAAGSKDRAIKAVAELKAELRNAGQSSTPETISAIESAIAAPDWSRYRQAVQSLVDELASTATGIPIASSGQKIREAQKLLNGKVDRGSIEKALDLVRGLPGTEGFENRIHATALELVDSGIEAALVAYGKGQQKVAAEQFRNIDRPLRLLASASDADIATTARKLSEEITKARDIIEKGAYGSGARSVVGNADQAVGQAILQAVQTHIRIVKSVLKVKADIEALPIPREAAAKKTK